MNVMYVVAIGSIAALIYAACMFVRVKGQPEGSAGMIKISTAVRKGAGAYLRRQYLGVGIFFAVVFIILLGMAFGGFLSYFTPFAFLTGGFSPVCQGLSECGQRRWQTAGRRRGLPAA